MSTAKKLSLKQTALALLVSCVVPAVAPLVAQADDGCNLAGAPATTLRNPYIHGAPYTQPGGMPYQGQGPAPGSGSFAPGVIPGDYSGPPPVMSGGADPTHGNMFPAGMAPGAKGPWNYVPGAGRRYTQNGGQQGMYEWGQGANGQGTYEGGYGNNGQGTYEGGYGNGGQGSYEGGQGNGGSGTYEGGQGNGGQGSYEGGQGNGGAGTYEGGAGNGGAGTYEGGAGNGGAGTQESGAGNGGAGTYDSGAGNGGTGTQESGKGNGGSRTSDSGKGNGGMMLYDFGSGSAGTQINGDGRSSGEGVFANVGPRSGAQGEQDRLFNNQKQGNKYEFQGPLPTVRTFSRYLVILGVVVATIFVAMAAMSIVLGNNYGGTRVIGAVAGLLLLLAGYTIWKIVQMNTFNFNSTDVISRDRNGNQTYSNQNGGANPPGFFSPENPNGGRNNGGNPNGGNPNGGNPANPSGPALPGPPGFGAENPGGR